MVESPSLVGTPDDQSGCDFELAGAALHGNAVCLEVERVVDSVEAEILPALDDNGRISGPDTFHCILDGELYMGGEHVSADDLRAVGITHIVRVQEDAECSILPQRELRGFLPIKAVDSWQVDIREFFPSVVTFIDHALQSSGKVYVHCGMGRSRSCAMVLAYLVKARNMTLRAALVHVWKKRDIQALNMGFLAQLVDFDDDVHGHQSLPLLSAFLLRSRRDRYIAADKSRQFDVEEVLSLWRDPKAQTRNPGMGNCQVKSKMQELHAVLRGRAISESIFLQPVKTRCCESLRTWLEEEVVVARSAGDES